MRKVTEKTKKNRIVLIICALLITVLIFTGIQLRPSQTKLVKKELEIIKKSQNRVIGYYTDYSYGLTSPNEIPWDYLTHLNYSFFEINENGDIQPVNSYNTYEAEVDSVNGVLTSFKNEHKLHKDVKVMLALGGWGRSNNFSNVTNDKVLRDKAVNEIYLFLKENDFNGVDIDWEYAGIKREANGDDYGTPNGSEKDRENYVLFVKELREKFQDEFEISIAAPGGIETASKLNLFEMNKYVDFFNVMTYDMHGAWDETTNFNAPLLYNDLDLSYNSKQNNIAALIDFYKLSGVEETKIILGIPFYGHLYGEVEQANNGLYANYEKYLGVMTLRTLYKLDKTYNKYFDEISKSTYYYSQVDNNFLSIEDDLSIEAKVKFAKENNLGGIFVWEISQDVYDGEIPYYLNKIIEAYVKKGE